jgi:hypothetical protein
MTILVLGMMAVLVAWIASNTYWDTVQVPSPPKGEALRDPFYAARLLAARLGARVSPTRQLDTQAAVDVIVLTDWSWDLGRAYRGQLQRWVEAGGRLVVDESISIQSDDFTSWTGIRFFVAEVTAPGKDEEKDTDPCQPLRQVGSSPLRDEPLNREFALCGSHPPLVLSVDGLPDWGLSGDYGLNAARVSVGRGNVTVIRSFPFTWQQLLRGDHPDLFVAATQLRGGDSIQFITPLRHPSLIRLAWQHGAPAILLGAALLLLALWQNAARFGPRRDMPAPARRSLAEQIRSTGQFSVRMGSDALHAATLRALREAAARRIPGFAVLPPHEQLEALSRTGFATDAGLEKAMRPGTRRGSDIYSAIALMESVRRELISKKGS